MLTVSHALWLALSLTQALAGSTQSQTTTSTSTSKSKTAPSSTPSGSSSHGPPPMSPALMAAVHAGNMDLAGTSLIVFFALAGAFLIYRIVISSIRGLRRLISMDSQRQNHWRQPTRWYGAVKKHILYAPMFRARSYSTYVLTKGWVTGSLPTRFQSIFITLLVAANVIYCVAGIEWNMVGTQQMLLHFQFRTGSIAVSNMIPIVLFSGRNNPFIFLLNIPYESFVTLHRWLGRIVAAEAIVHMACFMAVHVAQGGWPLVAYACTFTGETPQTGLIAICGFLALILTGAVVFRRAFYDLWHHIHVILVVLVTVALWYHLDGLPQQLFIRAFIMGWVIEHAIRLVRIIYRNVGAGGTHALIEYLPGDAVKITFTIARPWTFRPGQHLFVAIPFIGLWTTHPFSLAWSEDSTPTNNLLATLDPEKGHYNHHDKAGNIAVRSLPGSSTPSLYGSTGTSNKMTMTAIIRRRDGFTKRLWNSMKQTPGGRFTARAIVEGPYGGSGNDLTSYGTVLLFAGGVGITHQVAYLRSLVEGYVLGTVACRRLLLVWVIQSPEHLEWIRPWMTEILAMDGRRDVLRVQLYITQPRGHTDIRSPSASVSMFSGRPDVETIVGHESKGQIGAMAVSVCGPGGLGDEVRNAVRKRQGERSIDFMEEAFSW